MDRLAEWFGAVGNIFPDPLEESSVQAPTLSHALRISSTTVSRGSGSQAVAGR